MVKKIFEKVVIVLLVTLAFFLIFSMVSGLFDQLQIFSQLYLIELLEAFEISGATQATARDISNAFDWPWHVGLLHKIFWGN